MIASSSIAFAWLCGMAGHRDHPQSYAPMQHRNHSFTPYLVLDRPSWQSRNVFVNLTMRCLPEHRLQAEISTFYQKVTRS
jgi:hypothetical protein